MDRNTALAFILMGLVLLAWLWYTAPKPEDNINKNKSIHKVDTTTNSQKSIEKVDSEKAATTKTAEQKPEAHFEDTLGVYFSNVEKGKNIFVVLENDLMKVELISTGAKFYRVFLKNYDEYYGDGTTGLVQLINNKNGGDFNLEFMTKDGKLINTSAFEFKPETNKYKIDAIEKDSASVSFKMTITDSIYIRKIFTIFKGKYDLRADIQFYGISNIVSDNKYNLTWQNGIRFVEQNSADEATFASADYYSADELFTLDASEFNQVVPKDDKGFKSGIIDWFAIRNKYFTLAVLPLNDTEIVTEIRLEGIRLPRMNHGVYESYSVIWKRNLEQKYSSVNSYRVYLGPIEYSTLKEVKPSLTSLVDFGSFFGLKFIVRPIAEYLLLPLLKFLHSFISNYGIVIIIFSLIIKILLQPLTAQSMKSMKKMQLLQPKINELKEKYKDDPQKMNTETMKLYKTYGINPAGGCLPLLLQMPILIALYGLFRAVIDIRHQPFVWWINNLSSPDVIYTLPFRLPLFGIDQISGLALLMGITTFIQQKMTITDPRQKSMVYIMPILFTLLFAGFPSGLNLYYFMFNLFSIIQQYWMNKYGKQIELVPVKDTGKKSWMQKILENAEQTAKERRKQMSKMR